MKLIPSERGVAVFLLLHLTNVPIFSTGDTTKKCPTESSTIQNSSQKALWQSSTENEIILSEPVCVDKTGNLITRVCANGTWIPEITPTCQKVDKLTRKCPSNFHEHETYCIFITQPQRWEASCNRIAGSRLSSVLANASTEYVWMPFRRSSRYGPFESVIWGDSYGTSIDGKLKVHMGNDSLQKDCLILNTKTDVIYLEDCNNLHKHICFYPKEKVYNCPRHCVNAGIDSSECYCKTERDCEPLAEVRTVFQKNILSDLAGDNVCLVKGGQLLGGYPQALDKHRWLYTKEPVKCRLCLSEPRVRYKEQAYMFLVFEERKKELLLVIYNPEGLFNNAAENTIYCFTDAATYELRKRMTVVQIEEHYSSDNSYKAYQVGMEPFIGQYWCLAYYETDDIVSSNRVIGYVEKPGNEYALRIIINRVCVTFNCTDKFPVPFQNLIHRNLTSSSDWKARVMEIFAFDMETLDVLLHLSTPNAVPVNVEYYSLRNKLESLLGDTEIVYLKNSEFCLPEWANSEAGEEMSWSLTPIGRSAVPKRSCLRANNLPVFRLCGGDFMYGAEWSSVVGKCDNDLKLPASVTGLQSVLNETITDAVIDKVKEIIKREPDLPVLSIYYVAKVLENILLALDISTLTSSVLDEIGGTLDIADGLMNVEKEPLAVAQDLLNITDGILDRIDEILSGIRVDSDVLVVQRENVALHITKPYTSNVSGIVVNYDDEKRITIRNLRRNETFESVDFEDDFKLAYYIPEYILEHLKDENITIVTTVFFNDRLFVSSSAKQPAGIVLSIAIPEHSTFLPSSIPILFKSHGNDDIPECGFWDYGKNFARKKGSWSTLGGSYMGNFQNESTFHICSFSHLTHFALLILDSKNFTSFDFDNVLSLITYLGDFLSVCGILGIFLTALMFKKWRQKQGTIILLNLSIAIVLEIVLTQNTEMSTMLSTDCAIFGKIIHYIVVSKFSWMLIYSFLQYMRFVKVFNILPDNIVSISVIFGWGFAIIPVGIVAAADPLSYVLKKHNYCYPSGLSLYLGLMMPILIIIFINTFVFFAIIREVTTKTVESHGDKDKVHKLQMQLAALLFFVLGVPWVFGILSNVIPILWIQTCLIYLFCITTNVQGFILFLFYVVFNGETKKFWMKYFTKKEPIQISLSTKTSSRS